MKVEKKEIYGYKIICLMRAIIIRDSEISRWLTNLL